MVARPLSGAEERAGDLRAATRNCTISALRDLGATAVDLALVGRRAVFVRHTERLRARDARLPTAPVVQYAESSSTTRRPALTGMGEAALRRHNHRVHRRMFEMILRCAKYLGPAMWTALLRRRSAETARWPTNTASVMSTSRHHEPMMRASSGGRGMATGPGNKTGIRTR